MESLKKPYQCEICNKWYATQHTLQVHQKLHRENRDRKFSCSLKDCNKSFYSDMVRVQHEETHKDEKEHHCDVCSSSFRTFNYLKNHVNAVHSGQKAFKCEECGKAFARKSELTNHKRTHTGERPFQCEICNRTFNQRSNLQTHVRTTHQGEKRHKCPECNLCFKRRRLVAYHIFAKHRDEKPLQCTFCNKEFVYPQLFKKHTATCKLIPKDQCFLWTNSEDNNTYLVERSGLEFNVMTEDGKFATSDAHSEQQNSAAIQSDYQEATNIIPDHYRESMVHFQPNNNIQEIIDTSYSPANIPSFQTISSVLLEPNTRQETIATQNEISNEMFQAFYNEQDGHWYNFNYVEENLGNLNEASNNINIIDSSNSTSLQGLLQAEPRDIDIINTLTENTEGANFQFFYDRLFE